MTFTPRNCSLPMIFRRQLSLQYRSHFRGDPE